MQKNVDNLLWTACGFVIVVYLFAGIFNYGFLASDEYWDAINRYIPAQKASLSHLVYEDDVKSPTQIFPMFAVSQFALKLGVVRPFYQYRFVIIIFSLLHGMIAVLSFWWMRRSTVYLKGHWEQVGFLVLYCFHFAMPAVGTRAMFESLAMPWVLLFAVTALIYDFKPSWRILALGTFAISVAFLLRPQTGICALTLLILAIFKRRWNDLTFLCGIGFLALLVTGIPDLVLRGGWHYSLRSLIGYNVQFGSDYIEQPWYFFFPLIFAFMGGPWMIKRYPSKFLNKFIEGRSLTIILGLFLIEHMCFANKWERFLFPIFPVLLLLMIPMLGDMFLKWRRYRVRIITLLCFNFLGWSLVTFSPAQKSIIDLTLFLGENPAIQNIYNIDDAVSWLPDALIGKQGEQLIAASSGKIEQIFANLKAGDSVVMRQIQWDENFLKRHRHLVAHKFDVNFIDALAYQLNPSHNLRRSPLILVLLKTH